MSRKKRLCPGLLITAALFMIIAEAAPSVGFILRLTALGLSAAAFLVWLTGPFESRVMRKTAKIILTLAGVLALVGLASFVWIEGLIFGGREGNPTEEADILVVLGAGLNGTEPSPVLRSRLDVTYAYMTRNPNAVAILSGSRGPNEKVTEASAMAEYLSRRGIDENRLILEENAHNTAQNIKFSVEIIENLGLEGEIMVISSEFHLYRAEKIFERFGIKAYSLPAETPNIGLVRINSYVREYCSVVVMGIKDRLGYDE